MFLKKVVSVDQRVWLTDSSSGAKPALGKLGADVLLVEAPKTWLVGALDDTRLRLLRLPPLLLPPLLLVTVPLILPFTDVVSSVLEVRVPVTSEA